MEPIAIKRSRDQGLDPEAAQARGMILFEQTHAKWFAAALACECAGVHQIESVFTLCRPHKAGKTQEPGLRAPQEESPASPGCLVL
jgi:hypothetical protein